MYYLLYLFHDSDIDEVLEDYDGEVSPNFVDTSLAMTQQELDLTVLSDFLYYVIRGDMYMVNSLLSSSIAVDMLDVEEFEGKYYRDEDLPHKPYLYDHYNINESISSARIKDVNFGLLPVPSFVLIEETGEIIDINESDWEVTLSEIIDKTTHEYITSVNIHQ